jgi:hypothetical protein
VLGRRSGRPVDRESRSSRNDDGSPRGEHVQPVHDQPGRDVDTVLTVDLDVAVDLFLVFDALDVVFVGLDFVFVAVGRLVDVFVIGTDGQRLAQLS